MRPTAFARSDGAFWLRRRYRRSVTFNSSPASLRRWNSLTCSTRLAAESAAREAPCSFVPSLSRSKATATFCRKPRSDHDGGSATGAPAPSIAGRMGAASLVGGELIRRSRIVGKRLEEQLVLEACQSIGDVRKELNGIAALVPVVSVGGDEQRVLLGGDEAVDQMLDAIRIDVG